MVSLMEHLAREKGWNRPAKPIQPESFESAQAEVSFLKACETYSRQTVQLCLDQITNEKAYIETLQARRHKLEQMFVPVSRPAVVKPFMPRRNSALSHPSTMTQAQIDETIRLLEQLAEGGE